MEYNKRIFASVLLALFIIISLVTGYYWILRDKENTDEVRELANAPAAGMPQEKKIYYPPAVPAVLTNPADKLDYLAMHYWDNFPMADTSYIGSKDFTEQALSNYLYLLANLPEEVKNKGIDHLIDLALDGNLRMFSYLGELLESYLYNPNSPMRNEEWYAHVLEHITSSPRVDKVYKIRPADRLKLLLKNRPGGIAENFRYTLRDNRKGSLHRFKAAYTLLLFFNPECPSCKQTIGDMEHSPLLSRALGAKKLEVLAIYADSDKELWGAHKDELPGSWNVGCDCSQEILSRNLYDLKAMPTLYLLDENKKVILKDKNWGEVERYINSL